MVRLLLINFTWKHFFFLILAVPSRIPVVVERWQRAKKLKRAAETLLTTSMNGLITYDCGHNYQPKTL